MIRAIIIDDEKHCIDRLEHLISITNNIELISSCSSVETALIEIKKQQPDVIFLDIEIHDKTGFDLLKQYTSINFHVIFVTAFEHYAIKAFKFSAFDYLLKPVDTDDFHQAIERLQTKSSHHLNQKLEVLLNNLNPKNPLKKLSLPTMEGLEIVDVSTILYCHSDKGYTTIHTKTETHLVSKNLKHFEELLEDNRFYRIHNSDLVNLEYVKKYTKGKGGYVTLTNGVHLDVSIRRKETLLRLLSNN